MNDRERLLEQVEAAHHALTAMALREIIDTLDYEGYVWKACGLED